jgi:Rps23 Pro-64 3,4-dihydroxylase Tpa1-like proline 4-hydroxylase
MNIFHKNLMESLKNNFNVLTHVLLIGKISNQLVRQYILLTMEEKMFRACVIILIMQLGFFIHGCTTLEYIDGSSKEELKTFKMPKYEIMNEMEKIRAENVNLQRQIDILNTLRKEKQNIIDENEGTIARIREENQLLNEQIRTLKTESQKMREENEGRIAGVRQQNELLSEQIKELQSENQRMRKENEGRIAGLRGENKNELAQLRQQNELLSEQIKNLTKENQKVQYENKSLVKMVTRQKGILLSQTNALKKYIQKLKIKVLSIDSKNSAENMAKKLNEFGYDIKSVSYAPQSKFSRNTVYFTQEFKDEAEQLAVSLGGNTTFKPLNWPSVFDLIVVTGENP